MTTSSTDKRLSEQDLSELVAEARDYAVMVCSDVNDHLVDDDGEIRDEMIHFIVDEINCTEECAHDIINHFS